MEYLRNDASKSINQFNDKDISLVKIKDKNFLQKILDKLRKLFK